MNSLPKTATQQCDGCDLNPDPSAPESSTLTTQVAATLMQTKIKMWSMDRSVIHYLQEKWGGRMVHKRLASVNRMVK